MSVQYLSHKDITLIEKSAFSGGKALDCFTAIDWFMSHLSLTTVDCPVLYCSVGVGGVCFGHASIHLFRLIFG